MADIIKPDLCVIGAGALGIDLAITARQRGLDVILVRRGDDEAGDPASGALRHAAFAASAERAQALRTANLLGLDAAEPKPNFRAIGERATAIADAVAARHADARLAGLGITLLSGDTAFADGQTLRCGEAIIRARHFALATGARPLIPALPGLDRVAYFTADNIGDNIRKLSHLVVIGGTPAALELAQVYRRMGSMVTLVPQGGLLPEFDPELVAFLLHGLREEGIVILDDATVTAILPRNQGTGVVLRRGDGEESLDVSHILLAMGRVPDLDPGLLDAARLRRDRQRPDRLVLATNGQTTNARISALGGAAGEFARHVGTRQAALLVDRLLGHGNGRLDPLQRPALVQTGPALAQLGQLESGRPLRPGEIVLRANLAENDAARATGHTHGAIKLIVDQKGVLRGAGAVGPGASETMALLALAASRGLKLSDLAGLALPEPSIAAALTELASQFLALQPATNWVRRLPVIGPLIAPLLP
jgi:pyruvate/2-oxoglutarate dehydrogenase complex dihydrolipoamide dehydrogenase (E3) component